MAASQTRHRFRDDVAPALVRAAEDPKLATVALLPGERDTMIRAARLAWFAIVPAGAALARAFGADISSSISRRPATTSI
jgi:hypothetical protein